ncbi:bacteriocin immunity protein [Pseudomonas leptonychotis]|jgi:hypothetical protein|uniref:bacteriocin immunity protein n=1 Tax=Pseudomonas leptonychotis TaxID=2448482 RepID=UPI0038650A4B
MNKTIADYTEREFIELLENLIADCGSAPDDQLADLLERFEHLTGHPAGSDLIYYPEPGSDTSAEGIAETVKKWRESNGYSGFKPG